VVNRKRFILAQCLLATVAVTAPVLSVSVIVRSLRTAKLNESLIALHTVDAGAAPFVEIAAQSMEDPEWSGESVKLLQAKLAEASFRVIEENVGSMWNPEENDYDAVPSLVTALIGRFHVTIQSYLGGLPQSGLTASQHFQGPTGPFSLRTVHWTVLRALEPSGKEPIRRIYAPKASLLEGG